MQIRVGEKISFGGKSRYQIEPGISGLGTAEIRTGDGMYAGVDGGYVSSQLYGFRTIVFTGFYLAKGCEDADNLRTELLNALQIRYLYPVFITTFGGRHYYTDGYIADIKADIEGPRANEFQITILCPDPLIYDGGDGVNSDSAWMEQTFYKEKPGGFPMEYSSPVQWVSGNMVTLIENIGSVPTYPIITLRGNFHNPAIYNQTTGQFVHIIRELRSSETVTIDMKKRIITLTDGGGNVVSIAAQRTLDSSWWYLVPGENKLVLTTDNNEDTEYGMIRYKQGFSGL